MHKLRKCWVMVDLKLCALMEPRGFATSEGSSERRSVLIVVVALWVVNHLFLFYFWQVWINQGDIILVGLRDYQDAKADVILKYNADEARNLKTYGEIPETVKVTDTVNFVDDGLDDDIEFGDDSGSGEDDDINDIWTLHLGFTILVHNNNKSSIREILGFSIATFHCSWRNL